MRFNDTQPRMPPQLFVELFNAEKLALRLKSLNREQLMVVNGFIEEPLRTKAKTSVENIEDIRATLDGLHPNFKLVTESIMDSILLSTVSPTKGVAFQPVLLVGEPGIGKSYYSSKLSELLGLPKVDIDFSTTTSSFVLSGTSSKWGNAAVGSICKLLMTERVCNGIVVIDEIDKSSQMFNGGDPTNSLLSLLEKHSAKRFIDEFLEVPIDASHLNYIATANNVESMPPQILSRFNVIHVKKPTVEEIQIIARAVYVDLLNEFEIIDFFVNSMAEEIVEAIGAMNDVRTLRRVIVTALVSAVKAKRNYLELEDIPANMGTPTPERRSIGFLPQ